MQLDVPAKHRTITTRFICSLQMCTIVILSVEMQHDGNLQRQQNKEFGYIYLPADTWIAIGLHGPNAMDVFLMKSREY